MKWNVDPEIFRIGPVALRYYSLFIVIGFVSMSKYVALLFKKEGKDPQDVSTLTTHLIVGMIIGARLGHCLFYDPGYYFAHPLSIFAIWEGGLASHGGYAGVLIAVALYLKKYPHYTFLGLMDMLAGPCLFVGGLIRLGNFMNSEIFGRPTSLPWGITFEKVDSIPRHPSQLYESLGYFAIAFLLAGLYNTKGKIWKSGTVFSIALVLSFFFRFLIEFTKDEQSSLLTQPTINMGQWLSLVFVLFGLGLFYSIQRNRLKP
jgi:prolipoprotein diacylglyceryl transferase